MADKERLEELLNTYRHEIGTKSPKSYSIWQENHAVMPAGVAHQEVVASEIRHGLLGVIVDVGACQHAELTTLKHGLPPGLLVEKYHFDPVALDPSFEVA